jgi:hypothetical protein
MWAHGIPTPMFSSCVMSIREQHQVRSFYVYDPDDIFLPFDSGFNEE